MADISPQGFIDEDVKLLLEKINSFPEYKTKSSCSGRIVLIREAGKKGKAAWLFKSHKKVSAQEIWTAIQKTKGTVWLLLEPLILHVKCKNLPSAQKLLNCANRAGFKLASLLSTNTCLVELRGSERLELPLKKELVNEQFVDFLVRAANKRLGLTKKRIKKLLKAIQN